jgi:hypothetical protein
MKCFYHPEADAVGTCKNCHRGVCRSCAAERSEGIACVGRCEAAVDQVSALIRRNVQLTSGPAWPVLVRAVAYWALAAGMIYLALTQEDTTIRLMAVGIAAIGFVAGLGSMRWLMKTPARAPK